MNRNNAYIIEGVDVVIFLAREKCVKENPWVLRSQQWKLRDSMKEHLFIKDGDKTYIRPNLNYIPLTEEQKAEFKRKEIEADRFEHEYIYNVLKEKYPNESYADIYLDKHLKGDD